MNNKKVRIIMVAGWNVFIEHAEAIKFALMKAGYQYENIDIIDDQALNRTDQSYYMNFIFKALRDWKPWAIKDHSHCVLVQTEELWNRREKGVYFDTGTGMLSDGYARVLEMYDENMKIKVGTKNVVYCPVGYSPIWEKDLPEVEEDIDVLFHGSLTPRRKKFAERFTKEGFKIHFTQNAFGEKRDQLIAKSKIDINIKAHDLWSYGPLHCLPAQANKKFMLAEKANGGYGPFKPGLHVAEYNGIDDAVKKVKYWLSHEKERKEFAINAYEDMVKTCDYTKIFLNAMKGLL